MSSQQIEGGCYNPKWKRRVNSRKQTRGDEEMKSEELHNRGISKYHDHRKMKVTGMKEETEILQRERWAMYM